MRIEIKNQRGDGLIEKGKILRIGAMKRRCILTGENEEELTVLGQYKDEEEAIEVLSYMIDRVVKPTEKEKERGVILIDLEEIEKMKNKERLQK